MKKYLVFLLFCCITAPAQVTLQTIYETPNSQINLYMVSQGYTTATMSNFDVFVTKFLNLLWVTPPFSTNQQYFRVITVKDVATTDGFPKAFNQFTPAFTCQNGTVTGSESIATFDARMDQLVADYFPSYNDNSYLMAVFNNQFYSARGGRYCFTTDFCNRTERTDLPEGDRSLMLHVLIHEFAHTFGLLGDEYSTTTAAVDPNDFPLFHNRNVTTITALNDIPWRYLIDTNTTPIPTCLSNSSCGYTATGLYEGANYAVDDWYRPQYNCKMNNVYAPFCTTCANLINEVILKHLCFGNQNITDNFVDRHLYVPHWRKSSNTLTSTSLVGNRINLNYLAQNTVVLQNGFHAAQGSIFHGYIGDCSYIDVRNEYRMSQQETLPAEGQRIPVIEVEKSTLLKLMPNPASNYVNVALENAVIARIVVLSIEGKVILFKEGIDLPDYDLNLSSLENGIYLLSTESSNGKVYTERIVKE